MNKQIYQAQYISKKDELFSQITKKYCFSIMFFDMITPSSKHLNQTPRGYKMRDTIDAVLKFAIITALMAALPLAGFSLLIQMP
jgi:hypothetical protein